jgi:hypothetical protein
MIGSSQTINICVVRCDGSDKESRNTKTDAQTFMLSTIAISNPEKIISRGITFNAQLACAACGVTVELLVTFLLITASSSLGFATFDNGNIKA